MIWSSGSIISRSEARLVDHATGLRIHRGGRMRDRFDIFGTLPDVIEDDWIDDIESFDERLRECARRRARATAFDLRYAADVEAPGQQCSYVARADSKDFDA